MIIDKDKIIYGDLSFKVNGVLFRVRKKLGQYKNEKQYCDAIEEELKVMELKYEREKILPPSFDGEQSGRNKVDFVIEDCIVLEVKAKQFITTEDYYQTRRYLDAMNKKLGILVNMRRYSINPKRILNSQVTV